MKWGNLLLFKLIHYSHYSYPFNALKMGNEFNKKIATNVRKDFKFYCSGLKFVDKDKQIRRPFLKNRVLLLDENNLSDISVTFIEDITHLVRGDHYWMRFESGDKRLAHVHQKGKKRFKDLLSDRELEVLELVAAHKTNIEIAEQLDLSKLTIETHRKNMLKRTGAIDTTALIHLCKMANII